MEQFGAGEAGIQFKSMYRSISKQHVQRHIKAACAEAYQRSMYRGISKQHVQRHIKEAGIQFKSMYRGISKKPRA